MATAGAAESDWRFLFYSVLLPSLPLLLLPSIFTAYSTHASHIAAASHIPWAANRYQNISLGLFVFFSAVAFFVICFCCTCFDASLSSSSSSSSSAVSTSLMRVRVQAKGWETKIAYRQLLGLCHSLTFQGDMYICVRSLYMHLLQPE